MKMKTEREAVVAYGKKLIASGLTTGTGGNISVCNRDLSLIAISPSGMDYFETTPEDVVLIDLDGNVVEGKRKPSSEKDMHRIHYMRRDDIGAVVHTHSTYSTILSTLRWDLPAVSYYIAIAGGPDVRCADYAAFGTWELAESSFRAMEGRLACFLANHGLLCRAGDLASAFTIAEEVERMAGIYCHAKSLGEPVVLSEDEVGVMLEKFKTYGQAPQP